MNLLRFLTGQTSHAQDGVRNAGHDPTLPSSLLESLLGMAWVVEARIPTPAATCGASRGMPPCCARRPAPRAASAHVSVGAFLHDLGKVGIPERSCASPRRWMTTSTP